MLNYIKAELWKVSRRQVFYILLALLVLCTAVFTGTSSLKGFPSLAAAVSNTMITGFSPPRCWCNWWTAAGRTP